MNSHLKFDFKVNKENNTIHVKREFAADLALVWEAWTKPEIIDLWWAPKPYQTVTKTMDFREGGSWLYCMVSPQDEKHWCKLEYDKIALESMFSGLDAFCDENGVTNDHFPRANWTNTFHQSEGVTEVSIVAQYEKLEDLEMIIKMGFKEGFTSALENLEQYIGLQFTLRQENKTDKKARVTSYLNFPGNTEEAFLFYQSIFKTEFIGKGIQRFGDIPAEAGHPPVAEEIKKMILHVELPILGGHILMGTDAPKEMGFTLSSGNNMHICLEPETRHEADRLFHELSVGGEISIPLADMFFGAYYGEFQDQYGVNWMVNYRES